MTAGDSRLSGRVRALTAGAAARLLEQAPQVERLFGAHPEIATLSVVSPTFARSYGAIGAGLVHAACAAPPICFLNDDVAELLDFDRSSGELSADGVGALAAAATRRGLRHTWLVAEDAPVAATLAGAVAGGHIVLAPSDAGADPAPPIAVGIDAAWLLGGESGAQVFVFEMVKALARRSEIGRIVLLSGPGILPDALRGVPKVEAGSWADAVAQPRLDILHRPYQPGADTDFARYRSVAQSVALTVLDFIAYDNPAYHESSFAFRAYQRAFDERVSKADQVLAISRHIGERLQQQFAHRLLAPVRTIHLGTDHLGQGQSAGEAGPGLPGLASKGYLLVLGNDFAHKNRDFAVKVFAEMCRRGYSGSLVFAGYHLDAGSSFDYELAGAGANGARILRTGPVPPERKVSLMRHAAAVLYPTSCEGFGLIPFEAAALGTPTAFVGFGPMAATLPGVKASRSWRVGPFADLVLSLIADPREQLEQIAEAQRRLTWERCAAETIATYRDMLNARAPWHAAMTAPAGPGPLVRLNETTREWFRRARGRISRLSHRSGEAPSR